MFLTGTKKKSNVVESILFKLSAQMNNLSVKLTNDKVDIAKFDLVGLDAELIMKKSYTQVTVHLGNIAVYDLNFKTRHQKVKLLLKYKLWLPDTLDAFLRFLP